MLGWQSYQLTKRAQIIDIFRQVVNSVYSAFAKFSSVIYLIT